MAENENLTAAEEQSEEDVNILKKVRMEKLDAMKAEGKNPFEITSFDADTKCADIRSNYEAMEGKTVKIAGRIMTWRKMGKAHFINIIDSSDRMQVYVRMNDIGEEEFKEFKTWDIGDIVEITGFVFKTRTGEISVHAKQIRLLSKSLLPLPEKFHGLGQGLVVGCPMRRAVFLFRLQVRLDASP